MDENGERHLAGPSRRVSFLGKCQVILPSDTLGAAEDVVEDYFSRAPSREEKGKSKGKLNMFRSRKSRRWSSESNGDSIHSAQSQRRAQPLATPPPLATTRPGSAPVIRPPLSPSLPISYDGAANRLRQKLVSPPPPTPIEPISPTAFRPSPLSSTPSSEQEQTTLTKASSDLKSLPPDSPQMPVKPLARPVAVRKPLTFGFDKEDEQARVEAEAPRLHIPPIVYVARSSIKQQSAGKAEPEKVKPAVLDWKEENGSDSSSSCSETESPEEGEESWEEESYEEDLHGECSCLDCEAKMEAALLPSYQPQWTRGAKRKYLADRKEAQNEQSRKAIRPPIWLTSEESEAAAASSAYAESCPTAKVREIRADEVDNKRGVSKRENVAKKGSLDYVEPINGNGSLGIENDANLRKEVDEEVRLREEEHRLKKTRSEMRRLSSDFGSGLRIGGGGARAMMRQLEEAEQAERRARVERSRSPRTLDEKGKEEAKPMGAIPDLPVKPFTPPPRIASPTVEPKKAAAVQQVLEKPIRTPSPLKRLLSSTQSTDGALPAVNGRKQDRTPPSGTSTPKEGAAEPGSTSSRHPSSSLLIQREITLGIPVQSNAGSGSRARQSWHSSPSPKLDVKGGSPLSQTPSPRLTSANGSATKLTDISEIPSRTSNAGASSGSSLPRPTIVRSRSIDNASGNAHGKHRSELEQCDSESRTGVAEAQGGSTDGRIRTNQAPSSLRRANTTGSRPAGPGMGQYGSSPLSLSSQATNGSLLHHHSALPGTSMANKAKAKARSGFRDFVARIKG